MDFDPMTGKLWDTENGPDYADEINLVSPGFNSGWAQVQGLWKPIQERCGVFRGPIERDPQNLVNFEGKGKYRAPEFTWHQVVGATALKFLNSDKLGKQYKNDMFVGSFHDGSIYHFMLNKNRTGLVNKNVLNSSKDVHFGYGFGGITDIEVGPDGYMYVLSLYEGGGDCDPDNMPFCFKYNSVLEGTIFRIVPVKPR
jgi:aldose sugar dehydrogenase